jgi:hypothetical protein
MERLRTRIQVTPNCDIGLRTQLDEARLSGSRQSHQRNEDIFRTPSRSVHISSEHSRASYLSSLKLSKISAISEPVTFAPWSKISSKKVSTRRRSCVALEKYQPSAFGTAKTVWISNQADDSPSPILSTVSHYFAQRIAEGLLPGNAFCSD